MNVNDTVFIRVSLDNVKTDPLVYDTMNAFELPMDHGVQINARSPAVQTYVFRLTGSSGYLPAAGPRRPKCSDPCATKSEIVKELVRRPSPLTLRLHHGTSTATRKPTSNTPCQGA